MKHLYRSLKLIAGAIVAAAFAVAGPPASAQDSVSTATDTSTSTSTSTATARVPRTTATPEMISEAIQRSQARSEKLRTTGTPEQFGSEEPFTFSPRR
jgi:hypothetical protein